MSAETTQTDFLHLHDAELEALARRGYQGGMPIELMSDAYLYEDNGAYFHTVSGRFAKIWKLSPVDASLLNNEDLFGTAHAFGEALNRFPEGSCGQFIRHTHRDIRSWMDFYESGLRKDADEFSKAISDSILDRQYGAALSPNGFFAKLTDSVVAEMRKAALEELNADSEEVAPVSNAIKAEIDQGRYPYVSDCYLVFIWEPSYMFGKFIDKTWKAAMASVGLADADKLAYEAYNKQVKQFGDHANAIAQALVTNGFGPEELTGQGLLNLLFHLLNPTRHFTMAPPRYQNDVPIWECLKTPEFTPPEQAINTAVSFSHIRTDEGGLEITDRGVKFHVKPVSVLGKPAKSAPGMMQMAMAGIESESLITINFDATPRLRSTGRQMARARILSAKQTMKLGDKETLAQQVRDMEAVKNRLSAENVTGKECAFDTAIHINLMGFDRDKLEDLAYKLESRLWRLGKSEDLRGDAIARASLPFNYVPQSKRLLRRDTPYLTEALSHMCPLFVEYQGVADPAIVMNNRSGQPIFLDLWGSMVNTAHSLIVGGTGSGKSFTFNNLLMAIQAKYKPKVWIIDKGDSYESLCLVLGGNYIRLATEAFPEPITGRTIYPICINPFYISKDDNGVAKMPALDDLMFLADMLVLMMTAGNGEKNAVVHAKTKPLLYQALSSFYEHWVTERPEEEPIMSDFMPVLASTDFTDLKGRDLVEKLTLFYGNGPYAALCDGKLQVDWDNDFTVLETQRMAKSDALGVVTLALFRQIDMYCKFKLSKQRKKLIAVDEAWATLSSPASASALASFYREMRKYNAGCLLISQTVKDFVNILAAESKGSGDTQDGILENTSHYFFLACSESDYRLAKSELAFSDEEIDLWESLASLPPLYSEIFYRMRTKQDAYYSGVVRLFASSVCLWIASSHPDDYALRETRAQKISMEQNVNESVARQRAIIELAKEYPYGAKYHVEEAA